MRSSRKGVKAGRLRRSSKAKLVKPLSKKDGLAITDKTTKLIQKRIDLNRKFLRFATKTNPSSNDWLRQHNVMNNLSRLGGREMYHLKKLTKKLAKLEWLSRRDPSPDRTYDCDLVRKLLRRFKRNLGFLLDEYLDHGAAEQEENGQASTSESDSEWANTSSKEDGESRRQTVSPQGNPTQAGAPLQSMAMTGVASTNALPSTQESEGKHKRKAGPIDYNRSTRSKFSRIKEIYSPRPRQGYEKKEGVKMEDKYGGQASVQDAQTDGK
ncbi:hypothetical protein SAMD00023353_0200310 [Rosellinia necatrix]|uniref:Uncharacterized protein n=1 Tax=Rosellinia necatrix TaxID=77044 RepID=A0A1S7UK19_ROSNE|nr:hypothetical protein SAMD00023353_0200310 [Rosellinia necatrix]